MQHSSWKKLHFWKKFNNARLVWSRRRTQRGGRWTELDVDVTSKPNIHVQYTVYIGSLRHSRSAAVNYVTDRCLAEIWVEMDWPDESREESARRLLAAQSQTPWNRPTLLNTRKSQPQQQQPGGRGSCLKTTLASKNRVSWLIYADWS